MSIDRPQPNVNKSQTLTAALEYQARGLSVIPLHNIRDGICTCKQGASCNSTGKHPRIEWKEYETRAATETEIRAWWTKWPAANIGIITGQVSGIIVLDVDGDPGRLTLKAGGYSYLPQTPCTRTGGGGDHYLYKWPGSDCHNFVSGAGKTILPNVDFRGDGGLFVAPPSLHKSGRRYEWVDGLGLGDAEPADAPAWLLDLIQKQAQGGSNGSKLTPEDWQVDITEGGRNDALTRRAGSLLRLMGPGEAMPMLLAWQQAHCKPPLPDTEVQTVVESIAKAEALKKVKADFSEQQLEPVYDPYIAAFMEEAKYIIQSPGILCFKHKRFDHGVEIPIEIPLANFVARPVREIIRDNGLDQQITFEIEGVLIGGRPLTPVVIAADKFNSMTWVTASWGLITNIEPGQTVKDRIRHAIQCLAKGICRDTIFTHLGWRKIDGKWCYLHANGAVGADNVSVDLSTERLQRYSLPSTGAGPDTLKLAFSLLDVAPKKITIPLLATVFLSILCEALRKADKEPAFVLWLHGQTGALKSSLAAVFLCFFGDFTEKTLPGSFNDSYNSLEKKSFSVKDSLLLVDDYHPTASPKEAAVMCDTAQKLLRAYGDRQGRGRMRADTSLRQSYPPRGLLLVTGEDVPDVGSSGIARYLELEFKKGDVKEKPLLEIQRRRQELGQITVSFVQWLAPQMDTLRDELLANFLTFQQDAMQGYHLRLPEVVSWLYIGFSTFLDFAASQGVIDELEQRERAAAAWQVLMDLAREQAERIEGDRPAIKFLNALHAMISSGLAATQTITPANFDDYGRPLNFIGWDDVTNYYLIPDLTYQKIAQFYISQGLRFPVSVGTLWKHLEQEKLIRVEVKDGTVRRTVQKKVAGKNQRVLELDRNMMRKTLKLSLPSEVATLATDGFEP